MDTVIQILLIAAIIAILLSALSDVYKTVILRRELRLIRRNERRGRIYYACQFVPANTPEEDPDPTPQGDELVTDPWDSNSYSLWPAPKHPPTDKDF